MKEKKFTGIIDGHFVTGTYTDKDDNDFAQEKQIKQEKREQRGEAVGQMLSHAAKIALDLVILGALMGGGSKK